MPVFCPHCHKMVAEQPTCQNCGKKMKVASPDPGSGEIDRGAMVALMRYSLGWMLGIVGVAALCVIAIYFLLG